MACSCKKSGCTNNRCSCFKEGTACTSDCNCENCDNQTVHQEEEGADERDADQEEDTLIGCMILIVLGVVLYYLLS